MSWRRPLLSEAVEHLAAEPADQQAYLDALGLPSGIDELALEFDDIAGARDDMLSMGELAPDEYQAISFIDGLLAEMSGEAKAHLWTPAALGTSVEWAEVRRRARECLHLMKQRGRGEP